MIKGLIELKNEVDILTINRSKEEEDEFLVSYLPENTKIIKTNLKNFNTLNRINNHRKKNKFFQKIKEVIKDLYFFPDVYKEWINKIGNINMDEYDLVISSSDTKSSHFIAEKIIIKKNKWVQIWGDPWLTDINLQKKNIFLKKRIELNEKRLIFKADKVLYISPITSAEMKKKFKDIRIDHINRGFLEKVKSIQKSSNNLEYKFVYTGVLNSDRNIEILLKKIKEYNEINFKKINLYIYGSIFGNQENILKKYDFIKLNGKVSYLEIKKIYSLADVLIFIDNGKNTTQIPGKIYDYLGTNKKIMPLFQEENIIYKYFIEYLYLRPILIKKINLKDFLESPLREIDLRFDNKIIAKTLLEKLKN